MFRIDNGTELINSTCLDFFKEKGVLLQRSMVKTPQRNRVAERKHKHLLDVARAIKFQAGFPKHFWGECVLSATHIINLLLMKNLSLKSPFEVLHGKPPKLDNLITIGCLCFTHNVGDNDTFASRATRSVLLGYTFSLKGYKLYDLQSKKNLSQQRCCFPRISFLFSECSSATSQ